MKKFIIVILVLFLAFCVYYFGKDYLPIGNSLEKAGYSKESADKIKELSLDYYLDNKYYKVIDQALSEDKYVNDYLNEYMEIDYVDNEYFIDFVNLMLENEFSTEEINKSSDILNNKYFKKDYLERYVNYKKENSEYSNDEIVMYTNIGIDQEFYSNISEAKVSDGNLILVNKYYSIDNNYDSDLVSISSTYGGGQMNKEAYEYFKNMCDAAKKDGISIKNISAYRSYSTQEAIYNRYVRVDGQINADTYSARPGHSEHQTGLATDINTAESSDHFENTEEYKWLTNNSYKYGFILRYPEGKTFITGYDYEPWHYRFVGTEAAEIIHNENITFEEYAIKYLNY